MSDLQETQNISSDNHVVITQVLGSYVDVPFDQLGHHAVSGKVNCALGSSWRYVSAPTWRSTMTVDLFHQWWPLVLTSWYTSSRTNQSIQRLHYLGELSTSRVLAFPRRCIETDTNAIGRKIHCLHNGQFRRRCCLELALDKLRNHLYSAHRRCIHLVLRT